MSEVNRRVSAPHVTDSANSKWGEDRREADAFIMTQLGHLEKRLEDLGGFVVFSAVAYFAHQEGYKYIAFSAMLMMLLWLLNSSMEIKRRHASVHKLMDRNWDRDAI